MIQRRRSMNVRTGKKIVDKEARLEHRRRRRALAERRRVQGRQMKIQTMEQSLEELQHHYERLCGTVDEQSAAAQVRSSFLVLAQEIHRLHEENAHLRAILERKSHVCYLIQSLVDIYNLAKLSTTTTTTTRTTDFLQPDTYDFGGYFYAPFSAEQCFAIVRDDVERYVSHRPRHDAKDATTHHHHHQQQLPLGWSGFFDITDDHQVQFQQTKVWPVHPDKACDVTWSLLTIPSEYHHESPRPQSVEILQRISDDIVVVRRRIKNTLNDVVMHYVMLLYRMRLGHSYLVAYVPLPLDGNSSMEFGSSRDDLYGRSLLRDNESFVWMRFHCLYEAVAAPPTNPPQDQSEATTYTRIHRWGTYACESAHDAQFWSHEILDVLLRLEFHIVSRSSAGSGEYFCSSSTSTTESHSKRNKPQQQQEEDLR